MPLPRRPFCAALLLCLAAAPALAQRKPALPAPPPACVDFYGHANSEWLNSHPLPAGSTSHGRWDELVAEGERRRLALLADTTPGVGPVSTLLADFIASGLDEAAVEAAGTQAIQPLLDQIGKIRRPRDVAAAVAALHARGLPVLIEYQVDRDAAGTPFVRLSPGGLGLPDPAFYTSADPDVRAADAIYRAYLANMMQQTGAPPDKLAEHSSWAVSLEVELARAMQLPATAQRLSLRDASKAYPNLDLPDFLAAQSVDAPQVTIDHPAFFQALDRLLDKTPAEQWKAYLRAQVANDFAPYLGRAFRFPHFKMFDEYLGGRPTPARDAWLRDFVTAHAPLLVDAAFQERHLPGPQQQRAQAVAEAVRAAQARAIERAAWLGAEGKQQALERLGSLRIEVGRALPAEAFAGLAFDRGQFAGNVLALRRWQRANAVARAQQAWPVAQWQPLLALMPQEGRLLASAALLQPPVLEAMAGPGDFGAFGALLAQQLSLHFQAWQGSDAAAWSQRATPLIAQYNAYSAAGGPTKVNGLGSFGQNQADLAGVELAWDAFVASGAPDAGRAQQFFLAWARLWARQDQPQALALAQATARHAPPRWRVNGPLSNLPAFASSYACRGNVAMQRPAKDQVSLWR